MILLDTNVISDVLRPGPDPQVAAWLDARAIETLWISTITVAEIRYGIAALPDGRRKETMRRRFEREVMPPFIGRTLDFTLSTAATYAEAMAASRSAGRALSAFDALIAATALEHRLAVATRDASPFIAVGLEVVDPFGPPAS